MKKEHAEQLGRQAAEADIADEIIDEGGNIIDKPMLREHLISQIIGKVEGTAFRIRHLREILELAEGYRSDFIRSVDVRLRERFPDEFGSPLRAIDEGDAADPLKEAQSAYVSFLVANRARLGIDNWTWKDDPEIEEWNGDEDDG